MRIDARPADLEDGLRVRSSIAPPEEIEILAILRQIEILRAPPGWILVLLTDPVPTLFVIDLERLVKVVPPRAR
jgi:hypothetical protein